MNALVLIPVYKENLEANELISIQQCIKILYNYKIVLFGPEKLNIRHYKEIFIKKNKDFYYEAFDNSWFESITGYNQLMLNKDFYKRFLDSNFMLIYQLDSYVFYDALNKWCMSGFDYIGAPWTDEIGSLGFLDGYSGNGGFSLRNTKVFYQTLLKRKKVIKGIRRLIIEYSYPKIVIKFPKILLRLTGFQNNLQYYIKINTHREDIFWSTIAPLVNKKIKIAPNQIAKEFAFETNPEQMYAVNNYKLPFGCHAWDKNIAFWQPFMDQ